MSGCIRTTGGVKIVCYLDSRLVFYDSDDFKSHRPAWIHDLTGILSRYNLYTGYQHDLDMDLEDRCRAHRRGHLPSHLH